MEIAAIITSLLSISICIAVILTKTADGDL